MTQAIRALRDLAGERHLSPVERLARYVREIAGEHALALAAPDDGIERAWRLNGVFTAKGETVAAGADPFRADEADPRLHLALADACAAATGPVRVEATAASGASADALDLSGSIVIVPLVRDGRSAAALLLPADAVADAELERIWLAANLASTTLARESDVARLRRLEAHRQREMREIARIQRRLLPSEEAHIRGAEIVARLDTCELAGGDYYDYARLTHYFRDPDYDGPDVFSVMVADVTGHGAAAAVEAAMFDALLRTYPAGPDGGPGGVLDFTNRHFFTRRGRSHLITAFGCVFDPGTGLLRYANAGHPPPLVKRTRQGGRLEWLDASVGIPIGVFPDFTWEEATCPFGRDDLLVIYTDGVIEAASESGEHFGSERLAAAVEGAPNAPEEALAAIRRAVAEHQKGVPARDDRTLVLVRRSLE
jgi:sigma-B regulation protein RsbU (phosphoserine phosphatase)